MSMPKGPIKDWTRVTAPLFGQILAISLVLCLVICNTVRIPVLDAPRWTVALPENSTPDNSMMPVAGYPKPSSPFAYSVDEGSKTGHEALPDLFLNIFLSLVVRAGPASYCLINGSLYRQGQEGPGFTVVRIDDNGVLLSMENGNSLFVRVGQKTKQGPPLSLKDGEGV